MVSTLLCTLALTVSDTVVDAPSIATAADTAVVVENVTDSSQLINHKSQIINHKSQIINYKRNWLGERCIDFGTDSTMYYNWRRDLSFVGVPIFIASFAIKPSKRGFRSARQSMNEKWHTGIDNYTQYGPYALLVGLKAAGYRGRSTWDRMLASTAMSNIFMAALVNATKYTVKEQRPDGTSRNSFPSGHTATAFVAATVLHKEYGLTRSPWFSVGGYALATGTGLMRVLNNRHWVSDVVAGAGIGIMSTELGYFITDLLFRNRGIKSLELDDIDSPERPSFFDIQMGAAFAPRTLDIYYDDGSAPESIHLGTGAVFGIEGAYYINKYIGVGGVARVTSTPANGVTAIDETDTNNFVSASVAVGAYGNYTLSRHFSLGAKALVGRRYAAGPDVKLNSDLAVTNLRAKAAMTYVLGASFTYRYKSNYVWKAFLDYDISRVNYLYHTSVTTPSSTHSGSTSKFMNYLSLGGAFSISF